jgi:hypothetical protein
VARTYPIRVANRYDKDGNMVGWSGPAYPDQAEISFDAIGVGPEFTTVTKLPRRVFTFSTDQVKDAVRANGVGPIFLNFCNYPQGANGLSDVGLLIQRLNNDLGLATVALTGWGPTFNDVREE